MANRPVQSGSNVNCLVMTRSCKTSSVTNDAVTFAAPSYSPRSAFLQLNVVAAG